MHTLCSEPGHWPDSIGQLDADELDALIEHATDCAYHLSLLDQDEEEFLSELRQTASLLFPTEPLCQNSGGQKTFFPTEMECSLNGARCGDSRSLGGMDPLYSNYRRWLKEQCPIEIMEVRYGGRAVCTFDINRDGGSWRFVIDVSDETLQFWTICRRHKDRVRIGACDLPRNGTAQSEASTLNYTNGQSISVRFSGIGKEAVTVLVHCTAPCPSSLRYCAYDFDSLSRVSGPEVHQYSKSSEIVANEFGRFGELRFPIRDLEAAHIKDSSGADKRVNELMQMVEGTDALQSVATTSSNNALMLRHRQPESNQPTQLVSQLKKWVACQKFPTGQLYRFSPTATVRFQICELSSVSQVKDLYDQECSRSFVFPLIAQREPLFVELCSFDFVRPSQGQLLQLLSKAPGANDNFSVSFLGYRRIERQSQESEWAERESLTLSELSSSIYSSVSRNATKLWAPIRGKRFPFLADRYKDVGATRFTCFALTFEWSAECTCRANILGPFVRAHMPHGVKAKSQVEQLAAMRSGESVKATGLGSVQPV